MLNRRIKASASASDFSPTRMQCLLLLLICYFATAMGGCAITPDTNGNVVIPASQISIADSASPVIVCWKLSVLMLFKKLIVLQQLWCHQQ
jgi:hypothetical protein